MTYTITHTCTIVVVIDISGKLVKFKQFKDLL